MRLAPVRPGEVAPQRAEPDALPGDQELRLAHAAESSGVSLRRQPASPVRERTSAASSR
jgi:hypothetical protein